MKIYEIIQEQQTNEGIGDALKYALNPVTLKGLGDLAKKQSLPFKNSARAIKAGEKTAKAVRKAIPFASKNGWVHNVLKKYFTGRNLKLLDQARGEVAQTTAQLFGDSIFKLFWMLNIGDAVIDYYAAKKVLEANPPADFDAQINKLRGIFMVQILAPGVAMGGAKLAGALLGVIPSFLKMMPGRVLPGIGITFGAAIGILTGAGAAGLTGLLMSEEGKAKVVDWLGGIVDGAGWMSSAFFTLIEYLIAGVELATGTKAPDFIKQAVVQKKPPAQGTAQPAGGAQPPGTVPAAPAPSGGGVSAGDLATAATGGGGFDDLAANIFANVMKE